MDLALTYDPRSDAFDLAIDAASGDLLGEQSLTTAVILSLMCDRIAQEAEVENGADRRGWWADAFSAEGDQFGSRLWLLDREKQLERTLQRARAYIQEALAWLLEDGMAKSVDVVVFAAQRGHLVAQVRISLDGESRQFRFEFSDEDQIWRLAGEQR